MERTDILLIAMAILLVIVIILHIKIIVLKAAIKGLNDIADMSLKMHVAHRNNIQVISDTLANLLNVSPLTGSQKESK